MVGRDLADPAPAPQRRSQRCWPTDRRRTPSSAGHARRTARPAQPGQRADPARAPPAGHGQGYATAYANYQQIQKKKSPVGWWIAGAALVMVIVVVAVIAIRAVTGGKTGVTAARRRARLAGRLPAGEDGDGRARADPNDGRVHGGPLSYPMLGSPWGAPRDRQPGAVRQRRAQAVVHRRVQL